jgi:HEAT repeat protein
MSRRRAQEIDKELEELGKQYIEYNELHIDPDPIRKAYYDDQLEQIKEKIHKLEQELLELPDLEQLVQTYLADLYKRFEIHEDVVNMIPLSMRQGKAPVAASVQNNVPPALRRDLEKLKARLQPRYSTQPSPAIFQPDMTQPETTVEDFLKEKTRVALLGGPGTGKSTTLRRMVRVFGEQWQSQPKAEGQEDDKLAQATIPVFAPLNQWQDANKELVEFLQEQLVKAGVALLAEDLPDLMQEGRILLLLDGLNEAPQLGRDEKTGEINDQRVKAIAALGEKPEWARVQCVLSCRVREFRGGPNWHNLHVLPLTRQQIELSIRGCYEGDPEAEILTKNLLAELYESHNERQQKLQGLAAQPFYLRRMITFYYALKDLPDNPAQLIDYSIDEALNREIEAGRMTQTEGEELRTALGRLAFNMIEAGEVNSPLDSATDWLFRIAKDVDDPEFSQEKVTLINPVKQKQSSHLLDLAERASLITTTETGFQFFHQLLQEFFCARYLRSVSLDLEMLHRVNYTRYNEVWPLWAGMEDDRAELLNSLISLLDHKEAKVRALAARTLGRTCDSRALEALIPATRDTESSVRVAAIRALGRIGDKRALEAVMTAVNDKNNLVSFYAVETLGYLGTEAIKPLSAIIQDPNNSLQGTAAKALGEIGVEAIDLLAAFLDNAALPLGSYVAEALASIEDERAIDVLITGLDKVSPELRPQIIELLGISGNKKALDRVRIALDDQNIAVRVAAAAALIESEDSRVIEQLIAGLAAEDQQVRMTATNAFRGRYNSATIDPVSKGRVIEALISALSISAFTDSWAVMDAVAMLGDNSTITRLKQVLKEQAFSSQEKEDINRAIEQIKARLEHPDQIFISGRV